MKTFLAFISGAFRNALQYRAAAIAGMMTQVFFGLVLVMVMDAFYSGENPDNLPISLRQTIHYIWLGQAFLSFLPWSFDRNIQAMISDGRVSYDFIRPQPVYLLWYSRTLGWRLASASLRALPLVLFATLVMKLIGLSHLALGAPVSAGAFFAFLASLTCAVLLGTSIVMLINISIIWTIAGTGAVSIAAALVTLFSGMVIPLPLFPQQIRRLMALLPFSGLVDTPFRLYGGHIPYTMLPGIIVHQLGWTCVLVFLGILWLKKGARRLVVQGG